MTCPWPVSDPVADTGLSTHCGDHKPRLSLSRTAACCRMKKSGRKGLGNRCGSAKPAVWPQGSDRSADQMVLYGSQSNIQLLNEEDLGLQLAERSGLP